jgi:hypothetical protein
LSSTPELPRYIVVQHRNPRCRRKGLLEELQSLAFYLDACIDADPRQVAAEGLGLILTAYPGMTSSFRSRLVHRWAAFRSCGKIVRRPSSWPLAPEFLERRPPLPLHDARRLRSARPRRGGPAGTRRMAPASTKRSLRTGAPAAMRVYQLAALTIGARLAVADAPAGRALDRLQAFRRIRSIVSTGTR